MVPNIVGFIRFTYGFHRTGSDEGFILDVWLGVECAANLCSDVAIILLLWKPAQMACVLKAFVLWNAVSMLWCCGGNLVGLRYPPKWWTRVDADELTREQQLKHIAVWTPVIIPAALTKVKRPPLDGTKAWRLLKCLLMVPRPFNQVMSLAVHLSIQAADLVEQLPIRLLRGILPSCLLHHLLLPCSTLPLATILGRTAT
ncbi:hypothetical protein MRX96_026740 [Rhipicephalus microplus]